MIRVGEMISIVSACAIYETKLTSRSGLLCFDSSDAPLIDWHFLCRLS